MGDFLTDIVAQKSMHAQKSLPSLTTVYKFLINPPYK